jgi:hypothetical protein
LRAALFDDFIQRIAQRSVTMAHAHRDLELKRHAKACRRERGLHAQRHRGALHEPSGLRTPDQCRIQISLRNRVHHPGGSGPLSEDGVTHHVADCARSRERMAWWGCREIVTDQLYADAHIWQPWIVEGAQGLGRVGAKYEDIARPVVGPRGQHPA